MPDKRNTLVNTALLGLLVLATIISLATGTVQVSLFDTLRALAGQADPMTDFVINELRLSRVIAGLLSGAALAMAGCLMQTLARNRLATPGIIGIDNAATAFAVASVVGVGIVGAISHGLGRCGGRHGDCLWSGGCQWHPGLSLYRRRHRHWSHRGRSHPGNAQSGGD